MLYVLYMHAYSTCSGWCPKPKLHPKLYSKPLEPLNKNIRPLSLKSGSLGFKDPEPGSLIGACEGCLGRNLASRTARSLTPRGKKSNKGYEEGKQS